MLSKVTKSGVGRLGMLSAAARAASSFSKITMENPCSPSGDRVQYPETTPGVSLGPGQHIGFELRLGLFSMARLDAYRHHNTVHGAPPLFWAGTPPLAGLTLM